MTFFETNITVPPLFQQWCKHFIIVNVMLAAGALRISRHQPVYDCLNEGLAGDRDIQRFFCHCHRCDEKLVNKRMNVNNAEHHSSKGIEVIQQTALRQMPDSLEYSQDQGIHCFSLVDAAQVNFSSQHFLPWWLTQLWLRIW